MRNRLLLVLTVVFILGCAGIGTPRVTEVTATPNSTLVSTPTLIPSPLPSATTVFYTATSSFTPTPTKTLTLTSTATRTPTPTKTLTFTPTSVVCTTQGGGKIGFGEVKSGIITKTNCQDVWQADVEKGDLLTVVLKVDSGNLVGLLQIYFLKDGQWYLQSQEFTGDTKSAVVRLEVLQTGEYFLVVSRAARNSASEGGYTLQLTKDSSEKPPLVSVSVETSCRSGPGDFYPEISKLRVGETTRALFIGGKEADYLIVNNPAGGGTCWLHGQYAVVTGGSNLGVIVEVPPVPNPAFPSVTLADIFNKVDYCAFSIWGRGYKPGNPVDIIVWEFVEENWKSVSKINDYLPDEKGNWNILIQGEKLSRWQGGPIFVEVRESNGGTPLAKTIPSVSCFK